MFFKILKFYVKCTLMLQDQTPISIVAFGADGASINRVMKKVGSLASR